MDTLKIRKNTQDLPVGYIDQFLEKHEIQTRTMDLTGMITYFTQVKNMRVKLNVKQLVIEGSITKLALGNNLQCADATQLYEAIGGLGLELGVDIYDFEVMRVDIAGNIITKWPVEEYYPYFIQLGRGKRREMENGLYLNASGLEISFYDKVKELKRKGEGYSHSALNENVCRYEAKYFPYALNRFFNMKQPTVNDIFENYSKLIQHWQDTFYNIRKERCLSEPTEELFAKKINIYRFFEMEGVIKYGGLRAVNDLIDFGRRRGYFREFKGEPSYLKRRYRHMMNLPKFTKPSTHITELESKIDLLAFHMGN